MASRRRRSESGTFDVLVREGDAAGEMLRAARSENADLLVVGHREGESAEPPSVAGRILQRALCAVLTVPV